jgi:hypothetical protein
LIDQPAAQFRCDLGEVRNECDAANAFHAAPVR